MDMLHQNLLTKSGTTHEVYLIVTAVQMQTTLYCGSCEEATMDMSAADPR